MIKIDMEMPESCEVCDCLYKHRDMDTGFCPLIEHFANFDGMRDEDCPLVEAKEQKWHVVADGDLPKKIIDEYGFPVEYIVMIAGAEEPTTAVMDEDGEWYDVAFEYYNIPESEKDYFNVVAWRDLPEPWEEKENTK